MTGSQVSPYARIRELAEHEHALVLAGRFEELDALDTERAALIAALPDAPSADAWEELSQAAEIQARTGAQLELAVRSVGQELLLLERGRATVRGYGASAAGPPGARTEHVG